MKQLFKITSLIFVATFLLSSCKKDKVSENATMGVSFKMNTTSTTTGKSSGINSIVFTSGSVTIREIVFDGDKVSGGSISITHEQVSTIDLMTGVATPPINVVIPMGEYRDVDLGVEIEDVNDVPSVIAGGVYTSAEGIETPIKFEFNSGEVFEVEGESHTFAADSRAISEVDFSPAKWFSTITGTMLDNATRVDGVILVNEDNNANIFDIVANKMDDLTESYFK